MGLLGLNPKVWITLGPVLAINLLLFISLLAYTFTKKSRRREIPEAAKRHTSKFLAVHFKEWWVFTTDPIARLFVRMGIRPSTLTLIGFLFSAAAAVLFAYGLFGFAGWVMIFGATFDIFDGRVARLTGQESRSGAFYDSVMDRFGEGACFLGLAFYFHASWVLFFVIAGLIGSMLVSYTRARGEAVGVVCKGGAMQRPERIVYIGVSSVLDPVVSLTLASWFASPPPLLLIGAIIIIAVMTNVTAVHRMVFIMNELDTADKSERETIPQLITRLSTPEGRESFFSKARYGYDRSKASFEHVVLFLLDGANIDIMKDLVSRGDLPNIAGHVLERGCLCEAASSFPSTTGPAFTPFITGCFPGTCNLPAVKWFDRAVPPTRVLALSRFRDYLGWGAYAMDYDLSKSVRTIFEYSRRAVNIFGMLNRGCGIIRDPAFFRLHSILRRARDKADQAELEEVAFQWFEDALWRDTDFVFYSFPSIDVAGAARPDDKKGVVDAYRRFDAILGRAVNLIKEHGKYDQTAVFIASDHGHGAHQSTFDLSRFLSSRMATLKYPSRLRQWQDMSAIPLVSGTSMAHVYLRQKEDWADKFFFEEIEKTALIREMVERPEIDLVAGRSAEGGVTVTSSTGRAHIIEDTDGRITYVTKGGDPFGLGAIPQTLDTDEAFDLTSKTARPDAIMQILQLFRSPRTGDLVISATGGCVLEEKVRKSYPTHGSLMREHSTVPFLSSIPLKEENIRTADIFALTLDLLGIETEHRMDGRCPQRIEKVEKTVDAEIAASR